MAWIAAACIVLWISAWQISRIRMRAVVVRQKRVRANLKLIQGGRAPKKF